MNKPLSSEIRARQVKMLDEVARSFYLTHEQLMPSEMPLVFKTDKGDLDCDDLCMNEDNVRHFHAKLNQYMPDITDELEAYYARDGRKIHFPPKAEMLMEKMVEDLLLCFHCEDLSMQRMQYVYNYAKFADRPDDTRTSRDIIAQAREIHQIQKLAIEAMKSRTLQHYTELLQQPDIGMNPADAVKTTGSFMRPMIVSYHEAFSVAKSVQPIVQGKPPEVKVEMIERHATVAEAKLHDALKASGSITL